MEEHIQIFDTTLRDGEQTPGVNFSFDERLKIAKQLEKWGVDVCLLYTSPSPRD